MEGGLTVCKALTNFITLSLHRDPPIRDRSTGSEELSNLPKVTQLIRVELGMKLQSRTPGSLLCLLFCLLVPVGLNHR